MFVSLKSFSPHLSAEKVSPLLLDGSKGVIGLCKRRETKKVELKVDPSEPVVLGSKGIDLSFDVTEEAKLLRNVMRNIVGQKVFRTTVRTILTATANGSGILNATISNSTLAGVSDFISLSGVFQEAFVSTMTIRWMPVSRYQYPLTGSSTLSVASLPLGCSDLQHSTPVYSNLADMSQNYAFVLNSTGDPFSFRWRNTEDPRSGVVVTDSSTANPSQSWVGTNNFSVYLGIIQLLTQSAPPSLPFSNKLADIEVSWDLFFRCRE